MPETEQTHGTARLTCRNHPTYRWVHTKYVRSGVSPYMGSGRLLFDGEADGKPGFPLDSVTEAQLAEKPSDFQTWFREHYTPECNCPFRALQFLEWVD